MFSLYRLLNFIQFYYSYDYKKFNIGTTLADGYNTIDYDKKLLWAFATWSTMEIQKGQFFYFERRKNLCERKDAIGF